MKIQNEIYIDCVDCNGKGGVEWYGWLMCSTCNGYGVIPISGDAYGAWKEEENVWRVASIAPLRMDDIDDGRL